MDLRRERPADQNGSRPAVVQPSMDTLRAMLTSPEFAAENTPKADFGPKTWMNGRLVPKVLLDLRDAGWLNGWPG